MAFSTKVGSFAMNTSTGNQSVTGLGFQPEAIIFFYNKETADGFSDGFQTGIGLATSSSNRAAICVAGTDNVSPTVASRRHDNTKCITYGSAAAGALVVDADFVSMDADGFTVNITNADATSRVISFYAFGGSDLTNVFIKEWIGNATTGNQSMTGVGFQPDVLMDVSAIFGTAPASGVGVCILSLGVGTSSSARGAMGLRPGSTVATQINEKTQRAKLWTSTNGGSTFNEGDLVSLDADGFTVNVQTTNSNRYHWTLCLKGGQYKVGSFNQKTSTGTNATTGVGFQPTGIFMFSWNNVTSTSLVEDTRHSIGAASAAGVEGSVWLGDIDAVNPQNNQENLDRTKVIKMCSVGSTTDAAADLSSFDSDGFTLDWTTADATAREIIYLAFGSNPGGAARLFLSSQGAGT